MTVTVNMNILITYSLAILVLIHSYKFRGLFKSLLLFFGAVIIGGGVENANAIFGGYHYPGSELTLFLGLCPFDVVLGWFVILYCCSYMSHLLIGHAEGSLSSQGIGTNPENGIDINFVKVTFYRALLAGLLAVNLDMTIDPVAVENEWWIWQIHNIYIQGVPLGNYLGWWLLISSSAFFYDLIIAYGSIKHQEPYKTAALWCGGTISACLITGGILSQLTVLFGLPGIRTEGMGTHPLDASITPERIMPLIFTLIIIFIAMGFIMVSSKIPSKYNEVEPPNALMWKMLPPLIMIIFWAMVLVVAFLTGPIFVIIGLTQGIPIVLVSLYIMYIIHRKEEF